MQLYTTQKIDGVKIESYLGLVIATQVSGTGFLSDLTAGISDIFGGHPGAYRNAMNELCEDVLKQLKEKAKLKGANAKDTCRILIFYDFAHIFTSYVRFVSKYLCESEFVSTFATTCLPRFPQEQRA